MNSAKISRRVIVVLLFMCFLLAISASAYTEPFEVISESNYEKSTYAPLITMEEISELLLNNGFTQKDLDILGDDAKHIAIMIMTDPDIGCERITNMKNSWIDVRLKARVGTFDKGKSYPIINGVMYYEDGIEVAIPHKHPFGLEELEIPDNSESSMAYFDDSPHPLGTGAHLATFTDPTQRYYEQTGCVKLPDVTQIYEDGKGNNTRPYIMFGAYSTNNHGFDTGLVYFKEYGVWKIFFNSALPLTDVTYLDLSKISGDITTRKWWEGENNVGFSQTAHPVVYLHMKFDVNSNIEVFVYDYYTWNSLGYIKVPYKNIFTYNPTNVSISRETSLAQTMRLENDSKLLGAEWWNVHLYNTNGNVQPTSAHLATSIFGVTKYTSYNNSIPYYRVGDNSYDKTTVILSEETAYHKEKVSIIFRSQYDINRDGMVNSLDLAICLLYVEFSTYDGDEVWFKYSKCNDSNGYPTFPYMCDFGGDRVVNMLDLIDLMLHYS